MNFPKVDTTISLRDIISLIAVLITGIVAFQMVTGRVDVLEKSDVRQDGQIEALTKAQVDMGKLLSEMGVDIRYLRRWAEEERRSNREGP